MGPHGRGTSEHFGVMDEIDLYIGAYAKSMAIIGGFVAGPRAIINYLRYNLRSQIYAKALPMAIVEGLNAEYIKTRNTGAKKTDE